MQRNMDINYNNSNIVYIVVHLYDDYGRFLIAPVLREEAKKYNVYNHCLHNFEQAVAITKLMSEKIEETSKNQYNYGCRILQKPSRQNYSYFAEKALREELKKLNYSGHIELV